MARGFTEPSRYGCVHEHLQLYKWNNYIYVNVIFYVYIRTHRWLYVVITTKVRYFLVRYFINAPLLVIIHISRTQKLALPFPCSKTKSKISFSLGWAQAVITTRRYVLENTQWWVNWYIINALYANRIFMCKQINVYVYIIVCDYVACSVACTIDVYNLFLLFVEMSSDVFV